MDLMHYAGREHTYFKHRVLQEYLTAWAIKVGRASLRLWYVDCFAGPWKAQDQHLTDTSPHVGLEALKAAVGTLHRFGQHVQIGAIFVEKSPRAYRELEQFLNDWDGPVERHPLEGSFEEHLPDIRHLIGAHPALIFVDPTGWKGADMAFIRKLALEPRRDILVNVMCNHINRFKNDERVFIREQMKDFLGLKDDIDPRLNEDGLMKLYCEQIKHECHLSIAADMLIPHPTQERVKYRLVLGARHHQALELFRRTEKKVLGAEAAKIRLEAREKLDDQLSLEFMVPSGSDSVYEEARLRGIDEVKRLIPNILPKNQPILFSEVWPRILQECHITKTELGSVIWSMGREGRIQIQGIGKKERSLKDGHVLVA